MTTPDVRIKSSFLLNAKIIPLLLPGLKESGNEDAASDEYIAKKVAEYTEAWSGHGNKILMAMCDVMGVEFTQNIIDAYVAPFGNSFSDPLVLSTKYSPDRFVDVLTHELTHRLLTDNTALYQKRDLKLRPHWQALFGDEHSFVTLVHIPVHAMLEYIFVDVLGEPERVVRDKEVCRKFEPYDLAWQYVDTHGYRDILQKLKEQYASF